jgi:hypothetical protein
MVCAACTLVLAACAGSSPKPKIDPNVFPTNYKTEILKIMPDIVADPSNMRDTGISDPTLRTVGEDGSRYEVCVRFNPRKSKTEYAGMQERLAIFYGGNLAQFVKATPEQCGKAVYQPFPELEHLCVGNQCKAHKGGGWF